MTNIIFLLISISIAAFISFKITPIIRRFGEHFNFVKRYDLDGKKIESPKVRIGGISISLSFISAISLTLLICKFSNYEITNTNILTTSIFLSSLYLLLGVFDDKYNLSPFLRLFFQFVFSIFFWTKGIGIYSFHIPLLDGGGFNINLPIYISILISSIWIVGIINAINWLDGKDGLASLVVSTQLLFFSFIAFQFNNYSIAFLSIAIAGSLLGFLIHNYYFSNIYMGDGGSYFIGSNLALISLMLINGGFLNNTTPSFINIFISLLILFVPLADMFFVICKRLISGRSPFLPDLNHLHHRLEKAGYKNNKIIAIISLLNLISGFIALIYINKAIGIVGLLVSIILLKKIKKIC